MQFCLLFIDIDKQTDVAQDRQQDSSETSKCHLVPYFQIYSLFQDCALFGKLNLSQILISTYVTDVDYFLHITTNTSHARYH